MELSKLSAVSTRSWGSEISMLFSSTSRVIPFLKNPGWANLTATEASLTSGRDDTMAIKHPRVKKNYQHWEKKLQGIEIYYNNK